METDNSNTSLETMLKDFADLNKDDPLVLKNCKKIEEGKMRFNRVPNLKMFSPKALKMEITQYCNW